MRPNRLPRSRIFEQLGTGHAGAAYIGAQKVRQRCHIQVNAIDGEDAGVRFGGSLSPPFERREDVRRHRPSSGVVGLVRVEANYPSNEIHVRPSEIAELNLSNAGYMQGDPRNGQRVDPEELKKFAFEKGNATGMQANDVVGALGAFVSKTGDLKTGMEAFEKMAILARATGSDVTDMADAMADVSNNLGDVPNKAEVLNSVRHRATPTSTTSRSTSPRSSRAPTWSRRSSWQRPAMFTTSELVRKSSPGGRREIVGRSPLALARPIVTLLGHGDRRLRPRFFEEPGRR